MKTLQKWTVIPVILAAGAAFGAPHYVSPDGAHQPPFETWAAAATNIQAAVDAALAGETVWVSNGVYRPANPVSITKGITLRSVNGPEHAVIDGGFVPGSASTNNRCLWIDDPGAVVSGFTISNGATILSTEADGVGAGVAMMDGGVLTNCTVTHNTIFYPPDGTKYRGGAGVFILGGGP